MNVYVLSVENDLILLTHDTNMLTPEYRKIISDIKKDLPEDFYYVDGRIRTNREFHNYLRDKLKEHGFKNAIVKHATL